MIQVPASKSRGTHTVLCRFLGKDNQGRGVQRLKVLANTGPKPRMPTDPRGPVLRLLPLFPSLKATQLHLHRSIRPFSFFGQGVWLDVLALFASFFDDTGAMLVVFFLRDPHLSYSFVSLESSHRNASKGKKPSSSQPSLDFFCPKPEERMEEATRPLT